MSTDNYLESLDLKQLEYARSRSDFLIRKKKAEEKVVIWRVSDECIVRGSFLEYKDAVDCLIIEAQKGIEGDPQNTLEITKELIIESELADYI